MPASWPPLAGEQHGIPVAEEAVTRRDGMRVGGEHRLAAGERAYQHEKCRLRQMEVGEQHIAHPETKSRPDEQACLAAPGSELTGGGGQDGGLESARHGRTDR